MNDNSQPKENIENTEEISQDKINENRELFKRALAEAMERKISIEEEKLNTAPSIQPSKRHKIRMNRIFRERVGGSFLPFPEVDNLYEKIRSKLVIKFKINELRDRREERKRKK